MHTLSLKNVSWSKIWIWHLILGSTKKVLQPEIFFFFTHFTSTLLHLSRRQFQLVGPVRSPLILRRMMVFSRHLLLLPRSPSVSRSPQIHTRTPSPHSNAAKSTRRYIKKFTCSESVQPFYSKDVKIFKDLFWFLCFPAVYSSPTCKALQRRGGVWREPGVYWWLWVLGYWSEEWTTSQHTVP